MTHPLAAPYAIRSKSGAYNMKAGDRVYYAPTKQTGVADEFLQDGEALITWDDGTEGIVNWAHLYLLVKHDIDNGTVEKPVAHDDNSWQATRKW